MILKDDKRRVKGLRKQFLKVKGKLWIQGVYIDTKGRRVIKLSDAKASILKNKIDVKRAVFNAVTKGIKLCTVENGFTSSTKLLKILNWGVKYGNDSVTVKRFARKGKYYTGVWVKGVRGMQSMEKYKITKKDVIYNNAKNNNLVYDNDIWSNDY